MQFDINECFVRTIEDKEVAKDKRNMNIYIINYKKINRVEIAAFAKFILNEENVGI